MITKIETEDDYSEALTRAETLWNAEDGTPEGEELDKLVMLIEEYEAIHYPIDPPSKEAAAQFRREQSMLDGMTPYTAHADELPKLSEHEVTGESDENS
jgi:HTH-type transcriptional regulator/antitoxin HigA